MKRHIKKEGKVLLLRGIRAVTMRKGRTGGGGVKGGIDDDDTYKKTKIKGGEIGERHLKGGYM